MTVRDVFSNVLPTPTINPAAAKTATVTGATVDRLGGGKMYQAAVAVIQTGVITDGSHVITLEESDDNSSWGTVAAGSLQGSAPTLTNVANAFDNKCFQLGYTGLKRYLRVKSTVSGTTSGGFYCANIILGDPRVDAVE